MTFDDATVTDAQIRGRDVSWLIDRWCERRPDHPLLVWEPRDGHTRTWTYAGFREATRRVAAGLAARGVGAGDRVLVHADNCPEMVIAWYACARLGAVAVTTNTRSAGPELAYFAAHTRAVGAVTQPRHAALVAEHAPGLAWIVVTDDDSGEPPSPEAAAAASAHESWSALDADPAGLDERRRPPLDPVGIMFTSGTTSRPKAVVHTHANAVWASRVGSRTIGMDGDSVYLIHLPFFHVNAQSWSMWCTLGVGGTVVLQPRFSSSRFWEVVQRHGVTHTSLIPFVFKALAGQPVPDGHPLRVGVFGLEMPALEEWLGIRVVPAYGMTETVIHAIATGRWERGPDRAMGWPTPGYEAMVVDPDTGRPVDDGEVGELWLRGRRGVQLFLEYLDAPEANAAAFTPDGWFRTGDRVRVGADGAWFYSERDKDLLKVGGENVSAREVEDVVREVPGITEVAVVGRSHEMLDQVPVAFVIVGPDAPAPDELARRVIELCRQRLADFKVPRAVHVVEEFPRATLDKVAKNRLRELADELAAAEGGDGDA